MGKIRVESLAHYTVMLLAGSSGSAATGSKSDQLSVMIPRTSDIGVCKGSSSKTDNRE